MQATQESKVCKACSIELPLDSFRPNRAVCKECANKASRLARSVREHTTVVNKICSKCGKDKPTEAFHKASSSPCGLQAQCKECKALAIGTRNDYLREYYLENRKRLNEYGKIYQKTDKGKAVTRATKYKRKLKLMATDIDGDRILWLVQRNSRCFWCRKVHNGGYHLDHFVPLSKGGTHSIDNLVIACPVCNMQKSDKDPEVFAKYIGKDLTKLYEEDYHEW